MSATDAQGRRQRQRQLRLLADLNRKEFREFDQVKAGLWGCGTSLLVFAAGPVVAAVFAGWSWWLAVGAAVGAALVWPTAKLVDARTYRAVARRHETLAGQKGVPIDQAAFREAALAQPGEIVVSHREVGFVFRILRALGVPAKDAERVVEDLETARKNRPREDYSEDPD